MDEGYCDDDVVFPAICMERRTFFAQGLVEKEQKKRGTVFMERNSYLVDPASSHMLVSKIKPCMCKYKLFCTVKLRMAH